MTIPGQPSISVVSTIATTSLGISWTLILDDGVIVSSYNISYSATNTQCFTDSVVITDIAGSETMYTVTGLQEGTEYSITVTAMLSDGEIEENSLTASTMATGQYMSLPVSSHSSILMAFPPAPSAAPTSVSVSEVTSSSITVQWGAVDCIHSNGDITGYSVRYGVQGNGSAQTVNVSGGGAMQTTISGLESSTTYSIEVAAVNSASIGLYSHVIIWKTADPG